MLRQGVPGYVGSTRFSLRLPPNHARCLLSATRSLIAMLTKASRDERRGPQSQKPRDPTPATRGVQPSKLQCHCNVVAVILWYTRGDHRGLT